jgi:hypothetical protein
MGAQLKVNSKMNISLLLILRERNIYIYIYYIKSYLNTSKGVSNCIV